MYLNKSVGACTAIRLSQSLSPSLPENCMSDVSKYYCFHSFSMYFDFKAACHLHCTKKSANNVIDSENS